MRKWLFLVALISALIAPAVSAQTTQEIEAQRAKLQADLEAEEQAIISQRQREEKERLAAEQKHRERLGRLEKNQKQTAAQLEEQHQEQYLIRQKAEAKRQKEFILAVFGAPALADADELLKATEAKLKGKGI